MKCHLRITSLALAGLALSLVPVAQGEPAHPPAVKNSAFQAVCSLVGTWVSVAPGKDGKPMTLEFKRTSADSAVVETMFPGSKHEMVNMYTEEDQTVCVTHYCSMGNQPHMRATSVKDGVLKFEFVSAGNVKSRDEMHMDSVELAIAAGKLTEKWEMYKDGKVTRTEVFEFVRQK